MKLRQLLTFLLIICKLFLFAQTVHLSGGINGTHFYNLSRDQQNQASYKDGIGCNLEFNLSDIYLRNYDHGIAIDSLNVRIGLSIDNYSGNINSSSYSHMGGSNTNAQINNTVLSLKLYLLNFKLSNFRFGIGGEINILFYSQSTAHTSTWYQLERNENNEIYLNPVHFGVDCYLNYHYNFSDSYFASIEYSIYVGLNSELFDNDINTKSVRQYLKLGFGKYLNLRKYNSYVKRHNPIFAR